MCTLSSWRRNTTTMVGSTLLVFFIHQILEFSLAVLPTNSCTSATDLQKFFGMSSFLTAGATRGNFLVIEALNLHQQYIWDVVQQYPRLRDIHSEPPFHVIGIHMCIWIASGLNATILSVANFTLCPEVSGELTKYPTFVGPIVGNFLYKVYTDQQEENLPKLRIGLKYPMLLNFAYCDQLSKLTSSDGNFSLVGTLFGVAELSFWIYLCASLILVSIIAKFDAIIDQGIVRLRKGKETYFMMTLSALLSNNISSKKKKKSILLVVWIYICLIFVTYYSGEITSIVISPQQKEGMTRVEQLLHSNYSFIFDNINFPIELTRETVEFAQTGNLTNSKSTSDQLLSFQVMKMINEAKIMSRVDELWEMLAIGGKYAVYVTWPSAIFAANRGNKFLSDRGINNRRCAIGKELRYFINFHHGFKGYGNEKLAQVALAMDEAGFYALWWKEFFGLATSRKVQGRSRVVSPTKILDDRDQAKPLQLEGKLKDVFFVWILCLIISITVFAIECCYSFC